MSGSDQNQSGIWDLRSLLPSEFVDESARQSIPDNRAVRSEEPASPASLPVSVESADAAPVRKIMLIGPVQERAGDAGASVAPAPPALSPTAVDGRRAAGFRRVPVAIGALVSVLVVGVFAMVARGGDGTLGASGSSPGPMFGEPSYAVDPAHSLGEPGGLPTAEDAATGDAATSSVPNNADAAEDAALRELQSQRDADWFTIEFSGQYVAQLASKSVGIVDRLQTNAAGSHTFHAVDILDEHRRLREMSDSEVRVVLLLSTDFGKRQLYQGQPLWITLAIGDFVDRQAVTQWCSGRFPDLSGAKLTNQCLARKLES